MAYDHWTPPEPTRAQLEQQVEELEAELAEARKGRRLAAQVLIECIGADGPESIEETASRAADVLSTARELLDQSFYGLETLGSLYNEQGVNQAHRVLSGGAAPRKVTTNV